MNERKIIALAPTAAQPCNTDTECALIGRLLLGDAIGKEALAECQAENLKPEHFFMPHNADIYEIIQGQAEKGEGFDCVAVADVFKRLGNKALSDVIELSKLTDLGWQAHNCRLYARSIIDAATRRQAISAAREMADRVATNDLTPEQGLALIQRSIEVSITAKAPTIAEDGLDAFKEIQAMARSNGEPVGVPSGFHDLDRMTAGFRPADLIIVAARPSMGKTALALNMVANMAMWRASDLFLPPEARRPLFPVLIFSMEMSRRSLCVRTILSEARVPLQRVLSGKLVQGDFEDIVSATDRLCASNMQIDDRAALSLTQIQAKSRLWRQKHPPNKEGVLEHGAIIVDYLQLAKGTKNHRSRQEEVAEISAGLKALAKELFVPVVALAQLNRAVDSRGDHRPVMSDLRESGAIEQDADLIAFIHRPEKYLSPDTPEDQRKSVAGISELIIAKQRNGPIGTVKLSFQPELSKFTNIETRTES